MPNPNQPPNAANLSDAARLSRSFSEIYSLLDAAAPTSNAFCPGHQVGFAKPQGVNNSLWIKDVSPSEVVVGCWGCSGLWQAPYSINADSAVTFGKAVKVAERFVPVEGEEMTDSVALTDEEVEILDEGSDGRGPRLRLLSSKANTVINGRVYPMALQRPEVSRLRPRARSGQLYSELPHPKAIKRDGKVVGFESNPDRRVSRIVNVEINDKGEVWTEHEFLTTPLALAVFASFRDRTGEYGISQRAIGETELKALSGRQIPIAKSLTIHTYDFVKNPALKESLSTFEVLLDSELDDPPGSHPAQPEPPQAPDASSTGGVSLTDAAQPALVEEEPTLAGNNQTTTPAAAPTQAAAPAPAITPEMMASFQSTMTQAQAIIDANAQRERAEAARAEVATYVASPEARQAIAGLPEAMHEPILARVAQAASRADAERVLNDEVDLAGRITAAARLAAQGFNQPAATGATTDAPGVNVTPRVEVTSNPTPHLEFARKYGEALDAHRKRVSGFIPDESIRKVNQPFINELIGKVEQDHGKALVDSAEVLLDDAKGGFEAFVDSTSTAQLWNQPTILTAILIQRFQDAEMLQFVDGIGPNGFEQGTVNGQIGSILKVPVEYYAAPSGSLSLPGYDNSLMVAEDTAIPEAQILTNWLSYAPNWRRIAASLTKDAERALRNGPLKYQAFARASYHLVEDMKRRTDRALAEEMTAISDEYQAVAVTGEAVIAANLIQNTGANQLYGTSVTWYAKLIGAGTSAAPGSNPVVRSRTTYTMTNNGQVQSSVINQVSVTAPASQVLGYLDANGQIQSFPGGGTATFAVDYVNGRVCFNSTSTVNGTTLPTISYTYVTNFDTFTISTIPSGVEPSVYYNRLLEQVDRTAATMGAFPRYMAPNLCLGSLLAMTRVTNAQVFYEQASPKGTVLMPSNRFIAERNNILFARHNTPWSTGDARLLLSRLGSTKYGVDTPMEIEGPVQKQSNGQIVDTKLIFGSENSVICTPQVTDQAGNVLNPVARSIFFR